MVLAVQPDIVRLTRAQPEVLVDTVVVGAVVSLLLPLVLVLPSSEDCWQAVINMANATNRANKLGILNLLLI